MHLEINRVEIKELHGVRYAFYFTLVKIKGEWCSFVSQHKCFIYSNEKAKTAFTREHFAEVEELVKQKMQNEH